MLSFIERSKLTEDLWKTVYLAHSKIYEQSFPHRDPLPALEHFKKDWGTSKLPIILTSEAIMLDDECIGRMVYWSEAEQSPNYLEKKDILFLDLILDETIFNSGIGNALHENIRSKFEKAEQSICQLILCQESLIQYFKEHSDYKVLTSANEYKVRIKDIPENLMRNWMKVSHNLDFRMIDWSQESDLDELAKIYSETSADIPSDEAVGIANSYDRNYFKILYETQSAQNKDLMGFSLFYEKTLVAVSIVYCRKENPEIITIDYTGVLQSFRQRGLAKWLKAKSLQMVIQKFPSAEFLVTGMAENNFQMKKINHAMGFLPVSYLCILGLSGSLQRQS